MADELERLLEERDRLNEDIDIRMGELKWGPGYGYYRKMKKGDLVRIKIWPEKKTFHRPKCPRRNSPECEELILLMKDISYGGWSGINFSTNKYECPECHERTQIANMSGDQFCPENEGG